MNTKQGGESPNRCGGGREQQAGQGRQSDRAGRQDRQAERGDGTGSKKRGPGLGLGLGLAWPGVVGGGCGLAPANSKKRTRKKNRFLRVSLCKSGMQVGGILGFRARYGVGVRGTEGTGFCCLGCSVRGTARVSGRRSVLWWVVVVDGGGAPSGCCSCRLRIVAEEWRWEDGWVGLSRGDGGSRATVVGQFGEWNDVGGFWVSRREDELSFRSEFEGP